jgi:hypothetical protein
MEILIQTDKNKNIIYLGGFNEKLESPNNFYINISEEDFQKYIKKMPNLYYENNILIEKKSNDLEIINKRNFENKNEKLIILKLNLQNSDYKIIKCYEAFMRQLPLPYNLEELSAQRDAWRAEINQLEEELKEYEI